MALAAAVFASTIPTAQASDGDVRTATRVSFYALRGDISILTKCKFCESEIVATISGAKGCLTALNHVSASSSEGETAREQAYNACAHYEQFALAIASFTIEGGGSEKTAAVAELKSAHSAAVKADRALGLTVIPA